MNDFGAIPACAIALVTQQAYNCLWLSTSTCDNYDPCLTVQIKIL